MAHRPSYQDTMACPALSRAGRSDGVHHDAPLRDNWNVVDSNGAPGRRALRHLYKYQFAVLIPTHSRYGGCAAGDSFSDSGQTRFRLRRPLGSALRSGAIPLLRSPPRYKPQFINSRFPLTGKKKATFRWLFVWKYRSVRGRLTARRRSGSACRPRHRSR